MPHLVWSGCGSAGAQVWFPKRTTRMEQSASEATGSKSGQFRSRVTTVVSQRRLNPSTSQTRELPNDSLRSDSSNERQFTSLVHESTSNYGPHSILASVQRQKWLLHFIAVACMICFTYDLIYVKGSPFKNNTVYKCELHSDCVDYYTLMSYSWFITAKSTVATVSTISYCQSARPNKIRTFCNLSSGKECNDSKRDCVFMYSI